MKFKIGNKVKFVDCEGKDNDNPGHSMVLSYARQFLNKGKVYEIVNMQDTIIMVKDESGMGWWVNPNQFELFDDGGVL